MIKKFFIAATFIMMALSMTSCKDNPVENAIERVYSCKNMQELSALNDDKDFIEFYESLPQEDQEKIGHAFTEKATELMAKGPVAED